MKSHEELEELVKNLKLELSNLKKKVALGELHSQPSLQS